MNLNQAHGQVRTLKKANSAWQPLASPHWVTNRLAQSKTGRFTLLMLVTHAPRIYPVRFTSEMSEVGTSTEKRRDAAQVPQARLRCVSQRSSRWNAP
jgi:hypothetical protein